MVLPPLSSAISSEQIEIMKILLEAGASVYDEFGSVLTSAIYLTDNKDNRLAIVKELLKYLDLNNQDTDIDNAMRYALELDDNEAIITELINYMNDKQKAYDLLLKNAIKTGKSKQLN